jgi:outer membrane protein/protease secretion system outer membrane protein
MTVRPPFPMRRALGTAIAGLLAVTAAAPAWASSFDLLQAWESALERDAATRAARAGADSAREALPQARGQLLPNVSLGGSWYRNDVERSRNETQTLPNDSYNSSNETLTIRQPLWRKPLFVGLEQAKYVVEDADATMARALSTLAMRVTGAYLNALLSEDQIDLIESQQVLTEAQLDAARKALVAGSGTRTDIDEAQSRLDLNRAQRLEAQLALEVARRELEVLVDRPLGKLARLDPSRLVLEQPTSETLEHWIRTAEANSPEIRSQQAKLEVARRDVERQRGGHHPTLDAVAQVIRSSSENVNTPAWSYTNRLFGVQLNIPLYAGGTVQSLVRQALAEEARAEAALEATRRDLALRIHKEFRGVVEGAAKIRAYEQAVHSARQMVTSSRRSFEAGTRTTVDILNAEQQLQGALRDLAQARYVWLASQVRLEALAGGDPQATLAKVNAALN